VSHHIYHTEGIVLSSIDIGESNRFLFILTKDLGLVGVMAQGIRELKSKLRGSLQMLSYAYLDLVRGKEVWRITNAGEIRSFSPLLLTKEKKVLYARLATLLRRLMPGEGKHSSLFEDVLSGIRFLASEDMSPHELKSFEALMVLRVLNDLGYWGHGEAFIGFMRVGHWSKEELSNFSSVRREAGRLINQALKESHL
jgi:DNA repair protein RecO